MVRLLKKYTVLSFVLAVIVLVVAACANMAAPSGGEVDLDPPQIVRTSPALNATQVKRGKIFIDFDENVTIDKPSENVIITPPQKAFPVILSANRRVTVELKDSLMPNMTYTIDFTSAIKDNNEGNPFENFAFSFSTGDVVDTLAISGKVVSADNLEPIKGIYVGLHSNLEDTAFTKVKFERISRTNESGEFTIRGIAPGRFKLYALDDTNRDYMYDNPSEAIAFLDTIIEPSFTTAFREDTTFIEPVKKDNQQTEELNKRVIDTIKTISYTRFLPDNIVLRSFKSSFQRQYLQKYERVPNKMSIFFGAPTDMPTLEALNFDDSEDWYVLEKTPKNDTLIYWIKDQKLIETDTLKFRITYLRSDSLNQSIPFTDTLSFVDRTRKKSQKELEKEEKERQKKIEKGELPEIKFLNIVNNLSGTWDTFNNISLEFEEPIKDSLKSKIKLQQLKDTIFEDIPYQLITDPVNPRKYTVKHRWQYGTEYNISIDSASIHSIYGLWNNKLEQKFKVKKEDEYGQMAIWVSINDTLPIFMELLDKSDKPLRKSKVIDNAAVFIDVPPGTYYARIVIDRNNNGAWDTGDYEKKLQPETVYYSPKVYILRAYSEYDDQDDPWRIDVNDNRNLKPLEITKQKPKEKESRRKQIEERERKTEDQNRYRESNTNENYQIGSTPIGGY